LGQVPDAVPIENALRAIGQGIGLLRICEWEIVGRIEMVHLVAPRVSGLGKAHVERDEPAADMRIGALEGDAATLVGVEAQM
jgi:hypothetical protein